MSLGFHGELHGAGTQWQILGNGYRVYSPVLRRFHRPDSLSPFAEGGLNAYAAFGGDPINLADPSGHFAQLVVGAAVLAGAGAVVGSAAAGTKGRAPRPVSWPQLRWAWAWRRQEECTCYGRPRA